MSHTAFIALGANLGQPLPMLRWAKEELGKLGQITGLSRIYRTAPVGGPAGQPDYLNAVLRLETEYSPPDLMTALHQLEAKAGRQRRERWEARVLDLDLILYDKLVSDGLITAVGLAAKSGPVLPHPRAWERAFVLAPLADLAPRLKHPQTEITVAGALAKAKQHGI